MLNRERRREDCILPWSANKDMQGLTDIHSHVLSGVDDGALDNGISMEMLRIAWKDGINRIILTPHNKPMRRNVSLKTMKLMSEQLQKDAQAEGMEFSFYLGNEVYYRRLRQGSHKA